MKLSLYTFDSKGREQKNIWEFAPVGDPEQQYERYAPETDETSGYDSTKPLWIREINIVKVGAGTLRQSAHKLNLGRALVAHRIVWNRELPTGKKLDMDVSLKADNRIAFEFLRGISKLPSLKLTLSERNATWYDEFEKFIKERFYVE